MLAHKCIGDNTEIGDLQGWSGGRDQAYSLLGIETADFGASDARTWRRVMTLYVTALFVHVLGTLALFIGFGVEGLSLWHLRAGGAVEQLRVWANISARVVPLSGLAIPAILLPGAYLAKETNVWSEGWIHATLGMTFLIAVATLGVTAPRLRAIRRACAEASGDASNVLRLRLRDPFLRFSLQLRGALGLGIVFLMIAKPNLPDAIPVIGVAIALGVGVSVVHRNRQASVAAVE